MEKTLKITLVTPTRRILEDKCHEARLPGALGSFGVRFGHEPLLTRLDSGPLQIISGMKKDAYSILGGFAEISDDEILVLADEAVHIDEINPDKELDELEKARKVLAESEMKPELLADASLRVRRHSARLATAMLK